jgi:hypothetical protein
MPANVVNGGSSFKVIIDDVPALPDKPSIAVLPFENLSLTRSWGTLLMGWSRRTSPAAGALALCESGPDEPTTPKGGVTLPVAQDGNLAEP